MATRKYNSSQKAPERDLNKKNAKATSIKKEQNTNLKTTKLVNMLEYNQSLPKQRRRISSDTALLPPAQKKLRFLAKIRDENEKPNTGRIAVGNKKPCARAPLFDIDKNIKKFEDKTSSLNRTKITFRKSLTSQTEVPITVDNDDAEDEVFVDGVQHFLSYKPETLKQKKVVSLNGNTQISPIKPNVYSSRKTIICQGIPPVARQPAKKLTLVQKSRRDVEKRKFTNGNLDIFNMEYLEDIILYQLQNDWKYVVPKSCNSHKIQDYDIDEVRTSVVNWTVQAHGYLDLSPSTLFITIRLFDKIFYSVSIPCNMCQLVILVLLWIVNKYEDNVTILKVSKLLALCSGAYSTKQFLKMEKKVLQFFSFDLNVPDTTIYVTYYIKNLGIESELLIQCVHYILECFALHLEFSRDIPSAYAAAATCLSLNILHPDIKIWKNLDKCIGFYGEEELVVTIDKMLQQLNKVQDPGYKYRQPYNKYSSKERLQASIVILQKCIAS